MQINTDWFYEKMKLIKIFSKEVDVEEVAVCLPLEQKTAAMIYELSKHTKVIPTKLDDYSTKTEAVKWLNERGIEITSKRDAAKASYFIDCAATLSKVALKIGKKEINVVELTRTGELYLKTLNVPLKAISVDSSLLKGKGENTCGTAFGLIDALSRLNIYLPGKKVVILGFGRVGKGCARILKKLGCIVKILEISELRKMEAIYEGFGLTNGLEDADIIVTCTGTRYAINKKKLANVKNGAIILNLGAEKEIEVSGKLEYDYGAIKKYKYRGVEYFIIANGYAANLAIGNGTPIEIMDRTFSAAILSLNYLKLDFKGVRPLPKEIEEKIANAIINLQER